MIRQTSTLLALCLIAASLGAQTDSQNVNDPLSMEIRFHDTQRYTEQDRVAIKVTLRNNSPEIQYFRLADHRPRFSLDFSVKNLLNEEPRRSPEYNKTFEDQQSVFTRDVSLLPGEEFSFVEELDNYVTLKAGTYVVSAEFYPRLRGTESGSIRSNRLSLAIHPDLGATRNQEAQITQAVRQTLRRNALPPDEVIKFMIQARMNNVKEQYFLYMDMVRLYLQEPGRKTAYGKLSADDQARKIEEYKKQLWDGSQVEQDTFSVSPIDWEIRKTEYDTSKATVTVAQDYKQGRTIYQKLYRYKLERIDGIWLLVDYSVTNLGTKP